MECWSINTGSGSSSPDAPKPHAPGEAQTTEQRLAASEAQLALAQELGGAYPFAWDFVRGEAIASDQFKALFGLLPDEPVSPDAILARVHPDDREAVATRQAELMSTGGAFEIEYRILLADGAVRWILSRGHVLADDAGNAYGMAGVNLDITQRKEAELKLAQRETALEDSERRLRGILNTMPQMVWSTLPDGYHDFYNDRWYEFTGVPYGSTDGEGWNGMFHPDDQERAWQRWRRSLSTGEPYEIEYRLRRSDGAYRWTLGRALPIRDANGAIERWFGTCTEIHDFKTAEEQRDLIAHELAHRIRNIFTVISSLIAVSANKRPEVRPYANALRARVQSLGQAYGYIRPPQVDGGEALQPRTVRGLFDLLLAPYQGDGRARIEISGDDAPVGVHAGTALALVLHELATNAVKFGALATADGHIDIALKADGADFSITWREQGGPPVIRPPSRQGFGTLMSERAAVDQLGGVVRYDWRPGGLIYSLRTTIESLAR